MAGTIAGPILEKGIGADRPSLAFETYLEANQEVARRRAQDAASDMISKVEKSPYGGYVVRSWPVELLVEPGFRGIVGRSGGISYQDL